MVAANSNRVEALKRIQIGEVLLPKDLAEGEWRWLTAEEFKVLTSTEKV
jgi:16S rRNA pseudouridine516 synthase